MRILLVEDNADHRELMSLALTGHDPTWQVEEVVSGEEALHCLGEEAYDLVFLDYSLPGRDGLEVLKETRLGEAPPPVVMVTGRGDEQVAVEAMKGGAYDYVTKVEGYLQRLPVVAQRAVEAYRLAVERKRAEEALRRSEERFRSLIENATDIIVVLNADGTVCYVSPSIAPILGYKADETIGKNISEFIHPDDLPNWVSAFAHRLQHPGVAETSMEARVRHKDGSWRILEGRGNNLLHEPAVAGIVINARDITKRKRAEEEIEQRHRELAALNTIASTVSQSLNLEEILNAALDKVLEVMYLNVGGMYLADPVHRKLNLVTHRGISKEFAHEMGSLGVDEKTLEAVMAERKFKRFILSVKAAVKEPVELKRILSAIKTEGLGLASAVPVLLQAKDEIRGLMIVASRGPRQFSEAELRLLTSIGQQIAIAIENARLLEEVIRHRTDLQKLSAQLVNAQEAERRRISYELHDEIGQTLTAINFNLAKIQKALPPELAPMTSERLTEAMLLTAQTLEHTRELSLDLRPSMLDDLGLVPTLRWYVNRYAKRFDLEVEFEALDLEDRLPAQMETVLYRAAQEALTNIARHAQASRVSLHLERQESAVRTVIEDNGRGFEVEKLTSREAAVGGVGLLGMQERVVSLGGRFNIESHPGQGTRLTIEIPV